MPHHVRFSWGYVIWSARSSCPPLNGPWTRASFPLLKPVRLRSLPLFCKYFVTSPRATSVSAGSEREQLPGWRNGGRGELG
jgi:hypothetical protein